jgi:MFS superfamily sulfate permease-like transporter
VFELSAAAEWVPSLRSYRRDWLQPDVVAGLTTAAVVIPQAMAYATIAGLPVQSGLYWRWCRCWSMPCPARRAR